jgi:hypothetical protein
LAQHIQAAMNPELTRNFRANARIVCAHAEWCGGTRSLTPAAVDGE